MATRACATPPGSRRSCGWPARGSSSPQATGPSRRRNRAAAKMFGYERPEDLIGRRGRRSSPTRSPTPTARPPNRSPERLDAGQPRQPVLRRGPRRPQGYGSPPGSGAVTCDGRVARREADVRLPRCQPEEGGRGADHADERGAGEAGPTSRPELAEANTKLEVALKQAEAASRAKSAFLANMSHELRTPLNAIIGYSEMLQEEADDRRHGRLSPDLRQDPRRRASTCSTLINDILDLSKIEAGQDGAAASRRSTSADAGGEVATTGRAAGRARTATRSTCVAAARPRARCTPTQRRVRQILLQPAEQRRQVHRAGRSHAARSAARSATAATGFDFRVSDTGIGMTPEQLGQLFQRVHQADASHDAQVRRHRPGPGHQPQSFCRMMGGDIEVDERAGQRLDVHRPPAGRSPSRSRAASTPESAGHEPARRRPGRSRRRHGAGHRRRPGGARPDAAASSRKEGFRVVTAAERRRRGCSWPASPPRPRSPST